MHRKAGFWVAAAAMTAVPAYAQSNIDPDHQYAWSENAGWTNWRAPGAGAGDEGVRVMADHLRGWVWAENAGWINVGSGGGPYGNTTGLNFGVNILPSGFLEGFAWGENLGWINFATSSFITEGAFYDSGAGRFRGYAWAENAGWINLDDAVHYVGVIAPDCPHDLTGDGQVNGADLALLLGAWGPAPGHPADFNNSGVVDGADLAALLGAWGPC